MDVNGVCSTNLISFFPFYMGIDGSNSASGRVKPWQWEIFQRRVVCTAGYSGMCENGVLYQLYRMWFSS